MDKRYQVFVSSTFADLQDERKKVQQAIMELDCIPVGMELFPAIDEEQFDFIKKVIDDSDYYLLIIGGRYGTLSSTGVSYTELEYRYAISKGIKVIAFLHKDPDSLPLSRSEGEASAREKLAAFRQEVSGNRLVQFWATADQLPGLTLASLIRTMKTYPAVGWVRGDQTVNPSIYKEMDDLRKENQQLKDKLSDGSAKGVMDFENMAGLDDEIELIGYGHDKDGELFSPARRWKANVTWRDIFKSVSPKCVGLLSENEIDSIVAGNVYCVSDIKSDGLTSNYLDEKTLHTIRAQFRVLGLFKMKATSLGVFLWSLTPKGEAEMLNSLVARKKD
ncbi:DUF4062 domain-containing protein [Hymenobacter psychrophilus]|uniref:DUF4062 domain-containing protein n=1 Tax=Hymenobacter psychrophilus TaxID=651662 RepID=A0A1H3NES2_9BACT|nr:DUF4062 domain-containing protein [Hymenobacter psychrophilus]SDY87233.1 protein of unknown function [Hymenobacter psychrophilus]